MDIFLCSISVKMFSTVNFILRCCLQDAALLKRYIVPGRAFSFWAKSVPEAWRRGSKLGLSTSRTLQVCQEEYQAGPEASEEDAANISTSHSRCCSRKELFQHDGGDFFMFDQGTWWRARILPPRQVSLLERLWTRNAARVAPKVDQDVAEDLQLKASFGQSFRWCHEPEHSPACASTHVALRGSACRAAWWQVGAPSGHGPMPSTLYDSWRWLPWVEKGDFCRECNRCHVLVHRCFSWASQVL